MNINKDSASEIHTTTGSGKEGLESKLEHSKPSFTASYQDLLDGTWRKKWEDYQRPTVSKHLIDKEYVTKDGFRCTCGEELFKDMSDWAQHVISALKE